MEIKYLRLIKCIVEEGSMAKAKEKLFLTQSALSHQLKEAENIAGIDLFERVGKQLVLTAAGERVYKTANEVLDKIEVLKRDIKEIIDGECGTVRLCTACFTNYYWLPELISRFNILHPKVEIKVHPEFIKECMQRLKKHELDAVVTNKPDNCTDINYIELVNDEMVALVNKHDKLRAKKYLTADDFNGRNLIIFSRPLSTVVVYERVLKPAGVTPLKIFEVPMTEAMIEMVESGMGMAVIPYWIAKPYINAGKVAPIRVTNKGLYRSLGIAYHKKSNYPQYFYTLIDFFKQNLSHKRSDYFLDTDLKEPILRAL